MDTTSSMRQTSAATNSINRRDHERSIFIQKQQRRNVFSSTVIRCLSVIFIILLSQQQQQQRHGQICCICYAFQSSYPYRSSTTITRSGAIATSVLGRRSRFNLLDSNNIPRKQNEEIITAGRMLSVRRTSTRLRGINNNNNNNSNKRINNEEATVQVTYVNGNTAITTSKDEKIPFIIERIPQNPSSSLYQEIAQMCITAFFNTDNNRKKNDHNDSSRSSSATMIPIWKEWQLAYLRTLQTGDLERRRKREPTKNQMFIARRVVPMSEFSSSSSTTFITKSKGSKQRPIILDNSKIQNLSSKNIPNSVEYGYGDIIGFVEVTQRPYGLGEEGMIVERLVLTNLSVDRTARNSGVGSALVAQCEEMAYQQYLLSIRTKDNLNGSSHKVNGSSTNQINGNSNQAVEENNKRMKSSITTFVPEMILEVEEDNDVAIQFYRKRGYVDVCIDPTSRRYDTTGLWLQQVRCKRLIMKKDLRNGSNSNGNNINNNAMMAMENTMTMGIQAFQRLRDNLFNVQL